jgi:hypothetical protein
MLSSDQDFCFDFSNSFFGRVCTMVCLFGALFSLVASGTLVVCENNTRVLGRRGAETWGFHESPSYPQVLLSGLERKN